MTVASERFTGGSFTGATFDRNLYWTELQNRPATIPEANPVFADPQINLPKDEQLNFREIKEINSIGDFQLSSKSPALKAGKNIENNGGKDYWQSQLSQSASPHIGAFGR